MKRQKKAVGGNGPAMATKRKEKRKVEEEPVAEKSVVVEERENVVVAEEAEMSMDWEEGPRWWWGVVDEQMSWGSFWCPSWDIEYLGEAYDALYSDVVWDYDLWDLRGINEENAELLLLKRSVIVHSNGPGVLVSASELSIDSIPSISAIECESPA